jgi:hypothetical protein
MREEKVLRDACREDMLPRTCRAHLKRKLCKRPKIGVVISFLEVVRMSQPTAQDRGHLYLYLYLYLYRYLYLYTPFVLDHSFHWECMQGMDESDYLLERYDDTWKYGGAKVDLLIICS